MNNTKTMGVLNNWWSELSDEKREHAYLHITGGWIPINITWSNKNDERTITVTGNIETFYNNINYIKNKKPTFLKLNCFKSYNFAKCELARIECIIIGEFEICKLDGLSLELCPSGGCGYYIFSRMKNNKKNKPDISSDLEWHESSKTITVTGNIETFYNNLKYIKNKKPECVRLVCFPSLTSAKSDIEHISHLLKNDLPEDGLDLQLCSKDHKAYQSYVSVHLLDTKETLEKRKEKIVEEVINRHLKDITREIIDKLD